MLNPTLKKDAQNNWWLYWTSDPKAISYDITVSWQAAHIQAGSQSPTKGVKLGKPQEPFTVQVAPAYVQAYESVSQPPVQPPKPSLTVTHNVSDGSTITGPISWVATPSAAVARVDFFVDSSKVWTENIAPYECNGDGQKWDASSVANGQHVLKSVAVDSTGNQATAQSTVTINVSTVPPQPNPDPTPSGFDFPATFGVFASSDWHLTNGDFIITYNSLRYTPANYRTNNPSLICAAQCPVSPDPIPNVSPSGAYAWTYGSALQAGFHGVNDTLAPSPQGNIRGYDKAVDDGCIQQMDGYQGIALYNPATSDFMRQVIFWSYKFGEYAKRGYDGIWSDNLFSGNMITAGWFYASCGVGKESAWDQGLLNIAGYLRSKIGKVMLGGNGIWRATGDNIRAAFGLTMYEDADREAASIDTFWGKIQNEILPYQQVKVIDGAPKYMGMSWRVTGLANQQEILFGWACATISGCAYNAYDPAKGHTSATWPSSPARHYLGKPVAPPVRSGNVISRQFEHGKVTADFSTRKGTFA
jgi:hypothetical protein